MEEEIKEVAKPEECCKHGGKFTTHSHHLCCGHKAMKIIIKLLIIFIIFSVGVSVGRHLGFGGRNFERGSFEQNGNGRMMNGGRFRGEMNNEMGNYNLRGNAVQTEVGGYGLQNGSTGICPMQAAGQIQVVAPTPVKTVTPVK